MAPNPYSDILQIQIASANNAMQSMLKANQVVYESFQTQITKIISSNTEAVSASLGDYMNKFQSETEAMVTLLQKQMMENTKA